MTTLLAPVPVPNDECDTDDENLDSPGVLRGEVWLTVQSRHAKRLIMGRVADAERPAIIGLIGFADRLRIIWNAARADDPYADWWLVKVDEALARARQRIKHERAVLDACIEQQSGLEIHVATTDKPYRTQLFFANPYAYWGAQLVAEFDHTARTLLTTKHVGLIAGSNAEASLGALSHILRGLFAVPQGYRVFRIDREAVRNGSPTAKAAAEHMGELPAAVLSGDLRPALAPTRASR